MAGFVQTRNSLQCRSHHQKLEEKYHFPNKIISNYKKNYDSRLYQRVLAQLSQQEPPQPSNSQSTIAPPAPTQASPQVILPEVVSRRAHASTDSQTEAGGLALNWV